MLAGDVPWVCPAGLRQLGAFRTNRSIGTPTSPIRGATRGDEQGKPLYEASGGNMRKLAILARLGFYATCIGIVGHTVISVLPVANYTYYTAKLIDKGMLVCVNAGFVLSLLAIIIGKAAKVRFGEARRFYIFAALGLIASGLFLVFSYLAILRSILWRLGISI
jgi:hypothetical protein